MALAKIVFLQTKIALSRISHNHEVKKTPLVHLAWL
jgi:hypothetical protein